MSVFLTENDLNAALSEILESAKYELIIISPYIKLHDRYKSILKTKLHNPDLTIIVVFGKNENDKEKSLNKDDFEFFKQFPNIQIRYEKRLHAKIFANDENVLITSMNLYDYSQDTNIESGILSEVYDKKIGKKAMDYFERVVEQSELIFDKVPIFEKKFLGLSSKYIKSEIEVDNTDNFFTKKDYKKVFKKKFKRNYSSNENGNDIKNETPISKIESEKEYGYCIRTGVKIPYNRERPFSAEAFKSWNRYKDGDYPEKFCHLTGEKSNGETSFNRPILSKNWKLAMEYEKHLKKMNA